MISDASIICLQETKEAVEIPNYECFNSNRTSSRSGGLLIGVHRSLEKHYKKIEVECDDIQAIVISKSITSLDKNLLLINVYDSQENSSFKKNRRKLGYSDNTLDILMHFIGEHIGQYEILIVGDFNARTGLENYIPSKENFRNNKKTNCCKQVRGSRDDMINERGKKLLDLICSSNLTILNGSTIGDILGEYTCYQYNGCSVVDYMITTQKVKEEVEYFNIQQFSPLSDHRPMVCCLKAYATKISSENLEKLYDDAPLKPKWNDEITRDFLRNLRHEILEKKILELENFKCSTDDEVYTMKDCLTSLLESATYLKDIPTMKIKKASKRKLKKNSRKKAKFKWFDDDCITSKREINKLAKTYSKNPNNKEIRVLFYSKKKEHKKLIKHKKETYIGIINDDILSNKQICWSTFNKLKKQNEKESKLDIFDMKNFQDFFSNLYDTNSLNFPRDKVNMNLNDEALNILNEDISIEEVSLALKSLTNGKAVGWDRILNEQVKTAGSMPRIVKIFTKLFNYCLNIGVYPWNISIINPLYKKGNVHNPDDYRAITLGSNIGKLFSSILLQRLLRFRAIYSPDTQNQLGFCKSAQTSDHILSLKTCIDKYVGLKGKRLYTCFIDFRKAFDTVDREALIYKLSALGIQGKFLNCLKHMYQSSKARVRMTKKLSETFNIQSGTEQGHPLSPELFKIYIHGLSVKLNSIIGISVPELNNVNISHLLWADDIVLMALDIDSLQILINELQKFCTDWGLEVNLDKSAVMVFNKTGRLLKESHKLTYKGQNMPSVRNYSYLGIKFSLCGSFKEAQKALRQKALRAYFALKENIDLKSISKFAAIKLFDCLILPVVAYGIQIWMENTSAIGFLINHTHQSKVLKNLATDPLEKLHLAFLKWTLGVGKNTTNAAVWGDCGRPPLMIKLLKQIVDYFNRVKKYDIDNEDKYVRHAYVEQRKLNLPWYSKTKALLDTLDPNTPENKLNNSTSCRTKATDNFIDFWNGSRVKSTKLKFYNSVKTDFAAESYLHIPNKKGGNYISKIRMSSHKFNIETGRHSTKRLSPHFKACSFCTDEDQLEMLVSLPFIDVIEEDELHVLLTCPRFHLIRSKLKEPLKSLLFADITSIFTEENAPETAKYLIDIFKLRFGPKQQRFRRPKT